MKTQINIQGQATSNEYLKLMLSGAINEKQTSFNGYILTYSNKKEAKKALKNAYELIKTNNPKYSPITFLNGIWLDYDCSTATIINLK